MLWLCRGLGAGMVAFCGWCCGNLFCRKAVLRRRALQQTVALLQRLQGEIGYRKTDLQALYSELAAQGEFPLLGLEAGGSFQALRPPVWFFKEERACFAECLQAVGCTPAAQECARLECYIARFETACTAAAADERLAKQLYGRLGLGVGAMLAITLL